MKPYSAKKGLPRKTMSLCPDCSKKIPATLVERDGKVMMEKNCPEHGDFTDLISIDVDFYLQMERYAYDGVGVDNPHFKDFKGCPESCGLCPEHKSHTALAIIDLTNRCNLKCPICFANSNSAGYVYEPTFEQVKGMLKNLRDQMPVGTVAVQFSGGEPTLSPVFHDACRTAVEMGFTQVQVATNGIRLANDPGFAQECYENQLHTVYLQFDAIDDEIYKQIRGVPLFKIKDKAVNNCRNVKNPQWRIKEGLPAKPMSIMLVPTVAKGFNDKEVVPVLNYAIKNSDVIRGVNYQPVALTARIPDSERFAMRYTQSELVKELCDNGPFEKSDFFPVPTVAPISELTSIIKNKNKLTLTTHPGCGCATFALVKGEKVVPIPRFVDIYGLFEEINAIIEKNRDSRFQRAKTTISAMGLYSRLSKYFDEAKAPEGVTQKNFIGILTGIFSDGSKQAVAKFTWDTLMVGNMHFMDHYNYDVDRVMRCQIHYPVPDGRIIPFCAYNSGPAFRAEVEKEFSVPLTEWRAKKKAPIEKLGTGGEIAIEEKDYKEMSKK